MKRLITFLIFLSIGLSACSPAPATDWCYTYSFLGGLPSGFSLGYGYVGADGLSGEIGSRDLYVEYTGASVSPSYVSITLSNPGASGTVGYREGDWWGSSFSSTTLPAGDSLVVASTSGSGTNKYIYVYIPTSARVTSLTFHGNGANPFPENDCPPSATATPAATATNVQLAFNVDSIFSQSNSWIDALLPIFAIGAGVTIAVLIISLVIVKIAGGLGGDR